MTAGEAMRLIEKYMSVASPVCLTHPQYVSATYDPAALTWTAKCRKCGVAHEISEELLNHLRGPGHVLHAGDPMTYTRYRVTDAGTPEQRMVPVQEKAPDANHVCPRCGGPACMLLTSIDCPRCGRMGA